MLIIQIFGSVFSLYAKYLLVKKDYFGWFFAALGAGVSAYLAFLSGLFIWFMLEIYSLLSFLYGYYKWKKEINKYGYVDFGLSIVTVIFMLYFSFVSLGLVTFLQLIMAFMFIIGSGLIILNKESFWGWGFLSLGHVFLAFITYSSGLYIFCVFQILSLVTALSGVYYRKNNDIILK